MTMRMLTPADIAAIKEGRARLIASGGTAELVEESNKAYVRVTPDKRGGHVSVLVVYGEV